MRLTPAAVFALPAVIQYQLCLSYSCPRSLHNNKEYADYLAIKYR